MTPRHIACALIAFAIASTTLAADLDANQAKAREIYARVISIPSQLGNDKVPEVAQYLAGEFKAAGFPADDIHILPFKGEGNNTASLVVRYRGNGKSGLKPILIIAHMDVVKAKREDWVRDPFTLTEENGFFYGRGTFDDKQGVTAVAATFLRLKAEKFVPTRDLILCFSGDEETAQDSTADTAKNHRDLIDAEFALNADAGGGVLDEQTGKALYFTLQTAEKYYADFTVTTHNQGGHSSQPRADNAIFDIAAAIDKLRALRLPVMSNETTIAQLKAASSRTPGELGKAFAAFAANPKDEAAANVIWNDPAYVGLTRTTCIPTMIDGGHAPNALPQTVKLNVNCRIFPGHKLEDVLHSLQEAVGKNAEVKVFGTPLSSDPSPLRKDVMDAVARAIKTIQPDAPVVPGQISGATDGLVYRSVGIPTYGVDGNFMKASEDFSHGLNERLSTKSFYDSLTYWHALLKDLSSRGKR